jgi:hypothetical protein
MKRILSMLMMMLVVAMLFTVSACTQNQRAKAWGGTMEVTVPPGEVFVNSTWKDADLWIITQNSATGIYYMHEVSTWGIMEGTVIIKP